MSQRSFFANLDQQLRTISGSLRNELIGAVIAALGVLSTFSVLRYSPAAQRHRF